MTAAFHYKESQLHAKHLYEEKDLQLWLVFHEAHGHVSVLAWWSVKAISMAAVFIDRICVL